jgi:hypothetical protein
VSSEIHAKAAKPLSGYFQRKTGTWVWELTWGGGLVQVASSGQLAQRTNGEARKRCAGSTSRREIRRQKCGGGVFSVLLSYSVVLVKRSTPNRSDCSMGIIACQLLLEEFSHDSSIFSNPKYGHCATGMTARLGSLSFWVLCSLSQAC